ncbi:MAG TPA: tRNA lysidine(34) synthetase TilS [Verrucomicrobiae bacterium]
MHRSIVQHALLERGEGVIIGVSGGVDSMVLLELLRRTGEWRLHIAHFNHCLRGAESDADEQFVHATADRLKLPFTSARGDVNALAAEQGISIEMAARELRHKFFLQTAEKIGIAKIALAHHADDQVETFWLRLLRGHIGPGLAGMRRKRNANATGTIQLVRPLLELSKYELTAFAQENRIAFREDSSNTSIEFLRNRLRREILPKLAEVQPRLQQISLRAAEVLASEKEFLEATAREWLRTAQPPFAEVHPALQREILRVQLLDLRMNPTFELIERLREAPGIPVTGGEDRAVVCDNHGRITPTSSKALSFKEGSANIEFSSNGQILFGATHCQWQFVPERDQSSEGIEFFDAHAVGPTGTIRFWQAGDRFQPIGMNTPVKLQDLLTNAKLSAEDKRERLVAVDSRQRIFWVDGLRISELHKVTPQTERVLRWQWRRTIAPSE